MFHIGFKEDDENFWMGNELLHQMTENKNNEMYAMVYKDSGGGWRGLRTSMFENLDPEVAQSFKINCFGSLDINKALQLESFFK